MNDRSPPAGGLSPAAVGRLSLYFRELTRLSDQGVGSIRSTNLGLRLGVSASVVRRDLSAIGSRGRRGVGYSTTDLAEHIGGFLAGSDGWRVVLVGVGSLGDALLRYRGFARLGFDLAAAVDHDPAKIGGAIGGTEICDVADLQTIVVQRHIQLAIVSVPASAAPQVTSMLVAARIGGILNFAPVSLDTPPTVAVVNVDLASELQRLAFGVRTATT